MQTLKIDPQSYASQGAGILGIRDSGKTYTATKIAEQLFDAGISFTAFDPIGVWRYLRVPGKGRGYPVVVAGGEEGDLPLTPANAAAIVRAAMQNGVSLVLDLYDPRLSKTDWKRIVLAAVSAMLFENKPHGLRHIFLEEAAEFAPQIIPKDGVTGEVYSIIERLARMGGNSRLGYTLINQRAEQVNKAVLELCDNLLLHRQKGKNSIGSLSKWLDIAGVSQAKGIADSLPTLPQGECWEWLAGESTARLVRVPAKNSFTPDRRTMHGHGDTIVPKRVDTDKFVAALKGKLGDIEAETKANDPKSLKAEIARLSGELKKATTISSPSNEGKKSDLSDKAVAEIAALAAQSGIESMRTAVAEAIEASRAPFRSAMESASTSLTGAIENAFAAHLSSVERAVRSVKASPAKFQPKNITGNITAPKLARAVTQSAPRAPRASDSSLSTPQSRILDSLGFWKSIGHDAPSREQVGAVAGYTHSSGSFRNTVSSLNVLGLLSTAQSGRLALSADAPFEALSSDEARVKLHSILSGPELKIIGALMRTAASEVSREEVGQLTGYEPKSGSFRNTVSHLNVLGVITKPSAGCIALSDWAREVLG